MKDTKAKDNTVTCSYMDMVVSTLWHLLCLYYCRYGWKDTTWNDYEMAQDEYGTADMMWHKIRTLLDDHYLRLDILNNMMQDLDALMLDSDHIIMQMTKTTGVVWTFQEIQWQYDLHFEMFWTHQSTIDEHENFTIDGSLYLASFAGNYLDAWRRDRVLIQWLSWPHIPIVLRYKSKIIRARLFKITWTLASARWRWAWDTIEWDALMENFRRSSGSMFKIGFEIRKLIEERYAKVQLS